MKKLIVLLCMLPLMAFSATSSLGPVPDRTSFNLTNTTVEIAFSPRGDIRAMILGAVTTAKHEILMQAYSFTDDQIAIELVNAMKRGVVVKIIVDKTQPNAVGGEAVWIKKQGVPVYLDNLVAIAHNKIMVIDDSSVITGSYNFTASAQNRNSENCLWIHSPEVARLYKLNWSNRLSVSIPLTIN